MASIREQVMEAALTAFNTATPAGVPQASRARLESFTPDELPAVTLKAVREEIEYESEGKRTYFRRRVLTLRVSHYVAGDPPDIVADPSIVWATKVLDGQFSTLVEDCIEGLIEWDYAAEDQPYLGVHQDFRIHYHTIVGDQTRTQ